MVDEDLLLTPAQVAVKLGASPRTLERWRKDGTGPVFVKLGHRVGYKDSDLAAFIAQQRRQHTASSRNVEPVK
jgi:predicted site-specific integrase-resolvase